MEAETQADYASEEPKSGFNIIELVLFGLARFYPWILLFAILGFAAGLLQSLRVPNIYRSQGAFLARLGEREKVTSESALGLNGGGRDAKPALTTVVSILKNRIVFERLAKELGPARLLKPFDPTAHDGPGTSPLTAWLHTWQKENFFKTPAKEIDATSPAVIERAMLAALRTSKIKAKGPLSPVITVGFSAFDPELAQDGATILMRLMRERHREFFAEMHQDEFISEQLATRKARVTEIEEEFLKHKKGCGFLTIREEKSAILKKQLNLDSRIELPQKAIETIDLMLATIETELEKLPPLVTRNIEEQLGPNPARTRLDEQITQLGKDLLKLEATFKPDSEPYLRQKGPKEARLAELEQRREETPSQIVVRAASTEEIRNPDRQAFQLKKKELLETRGEKERELTVASSTVERDRHDLEERLTALLACEPHHTQVMGELADLKSVVRRLESAEDKNRRLALLDETEEMSNLTVLTQPLYNPRKVAPERSLLLLQGLGLGAGIGVAFALLRQLLDPKLRYPSSVERVLGIKVLGIIPEAKGWRKTSKRVRKLAG